MPEVPEVPPEDEPGGIDDGGMSELPVPLLWPLMLPPPVPLLLAPPDSDGMPADPPDELPVPPIGLPPELPLVPEPEPPPVMPAQAPSSTAQAIGNIHLVIEHSR
jgi:hypothetical protein